MGGTRIQKYLEEIVAQYRAFQEADHRVKAHVQAHGEPKLPPGVREMSMAELCPEYDALLGARAGALGNLELMTQKCVEYPLPQGVPIACGDYTVSFVDAKPGTLYAWEAVVEPRKPSESGG